MVLTILFIFPVLVKCVSEVIKLTDSFGVFTFVRCLYLTGVKNDSLGDLQANTAYSSLYNG